LQATSADQVTNAGAKAAYEEATGNELNKPVMGGGYTMAKAIFFIACFLLFVAALAGIAAGSAALATQNQLSLVYRSFFWTNVSAECQYGYSSCVNCSGSYCIGCLYLWMCRSAKEETGMVVGFYRSFLDCRRHRLDCGHSWYAIYCGNTDS
jgi:hypothetical protein